MKSDVKIKIVFILGLLALCFYALWPSVERYFILGRAGYEQLKLTDPERYEELSEKALHLGLDLQGGMYLLLGVRTEEVLDKDLEGLINDIKDRLTRDQITFTDIKKVAATLEVSFPPDGDSADKGRTSLESLLGSSFKVLSRSESTRQVAMVIATPAYVQKIQEDAFEQVMETLRNRVDQLGVGEQSIQRHGLSGHRILIQLPGLKDPAQAKRVIGKVAALDFRIVIASGTRESLSSRSPGGCPDKDPDDQKEIYTCSDGSIILPGEMPGMGTQERRGYYLLEGNVPASGRDLEGAQQGSDSYGKPSVHFTVKSASSDTFGRLTRDNLGKQMAIILDNYVKSAPTLQGRITRSGEITGNFTAQEAYELALTLRSGALPASVDILEERTVGAGLGDDSIRQGTNAYIIGLLAVVFFMVFYYRTSGINAVLCLTYAMILILAALVALGATLTMPGIAGLVLTLGMGVDANVVIFERMRDELKLGRSSRTAIAAGFDKAFSAIADSNISTLIAALVLLQFGSGPVRGFGVTLAIGVVATLFSALVGSRLLFDLVTHYARDFKLRFRVFVENTAIDFFKWRMVAIVGSLVIIGLGGLAMGYNRAAHGSVLNWGIDFSGGSLLQVKFERPVEISEVRSVLGSAGYDNASIQLLGEDGKEVLIRSSIAEESMAKSKAEYQKKIQEGVKVPYHFDTTAPPNELILIPDAGAKVEDLHAAVNATNLGENAQAAVDSGRIHVHILEITARVLRSLRAHFEGAPDQPAPTGGANHVEERRAELVGPQVGDELKEAALLALLFAVIATLIFLSIRFEFPYALGAVVASFHDAIMILAFFAIFWWEVDLTIVAALLTIVGYSLNDTIVIFDRVRENQKRFRREGFIRLINESLNETLSRTILTSLTVLMTVLALVVLGGDVIRGFGLAMLIGVVAGCYSTIYIASPVVYYWGVLQENRRSGSKR